MGGLVEVYQNDPIVIVEEPTGIQYEGQVGGMACLHPRVEGFLLPLSPEGWKSLEAISCPAACWGASISESLADVISAAWPEGFGVVQILFDRERIDSGTECWFPVRIEAPAPQETYRNRDLCWLDGKKGWLLMPDNCD